MMLSFVHDQISKSGITRVSAPHHPAWQPPTHLAGKDSRGIILLEKLLSLAGDWKIYLIESQANSETEFEQHGRTGRPLGGESFIEKAGHFLQRDLKKKKPGPKRAVGSN